MDDTTTLGYFCTKVRKLSQSSHSGDARKVPTSRAVETTKKPRKKSRAKKKPKPVTIKSPAGTVTVLPKPGRSVDEVLLSCLAEIEAKKAA